MITVEFEEQGRIDDGLLKFAVIAARYDGRWIFCRQKKRATWEIPGGHREPGESITDTASRELHEETGAVDFKLSPVCVYGVVSDGAVTYGMLFFAEVKTLGQLPPEMEIAEIRFCDAPPDNLTYPEIQPHLYSRIQGWLGL